MDHTLFTSCLNGSKVVCVNKLQYLGHVNESISDSDDIERERWALTMCGNLLAVEICTLFGLGQNNTL